MLILETFQRALVIVLCVLGNVAANLRTCAAALVTPLFEKNAGKVLACELPYVLSMSRIVVLAFAVAMLRQVWMSGVDGWPQATLCISIVLALPLFRAFDQATPAQLTELAQAMLNRFGTGDVAPPRAG